MREKISRLLDEETVKHRKNRQDKEWTQKKDRQKARGDLTIAALGKKGNQIKWPEPKSETYQSPKRVPSGPMERGLWVFPKFRRHFSSKIFVHQDGRIIAGTEVGQVLFDAAMLYEAMSIHRDKKLIQKYLHHDPPLHPRRTLDQAYYWTLKSTKTRDRDQVVYRGTRANPAFVHKINEVSKKWNCQIQSEDKPEKRRICRHKPRTEPDEDIRKPMTEEEKQIERLGHRCADCRRHIRQVSRAVMVDQLWMWILDERTVITAFPKRYGVNKQDYSGVHKAIQFRLQGLRSNHIRTVFDLALIILDECSNIFFDRTKTQVRPLYKYSLSDDLLQNPKELPNRTGNRKSWTSSRKP